MLKAVIIDDESDARDSLKILLHKFITDIEVIGSAEGVRTGLEVIHSLQPDVVFLDINMEDGTGFDLMEQVKDFNFHLVFITAYNQYAIKAFKYAAFDYLLKPVDLQELRKCVQRIQEFNPSFISKEQLHEFTTAREKGANSKLTLPNLNGFDIIDIADIIRCEGQKNYTTFFLKDGKKILVSRTLKDYERLLTEHNFLRVFQSHLINLGCIKKYIKGRGGEVIMSDGISIPVSREKKSELLEKLSLL